MAVKILLVEDDVSLAKSVKRTLEENGFFVNHFSSGYESVGAMDKYNFDLILLDVGLSDISGFEVCRKIRKNNKSIPIIILSARDQVDDKVKGLDLGADDYMTKPFQHSELLARIRAHTRPRENPTGDNHLSFSDIEMDLNRHTVKRGDTMIALSPKEFSLLEFFIRSPEKLHSRSLIEEKVWDRNVDLRTNVVDVYVNYLRKKINIEGKPNLIHAIRGSGYIMEEREE